MTKRDNRWWFTTKCGREIRLRAVHIRPFDAEFLEGRADLIRQHVLKDLADTARRLLPGTTAVFIEPVPGSDDSYPALIFFGDFTCYQPITPEADCSFLAAVWFADDLSQPIPEFVAPRVAELDWALHAADGYW